MKLFISICLLFYTAGSFSQDLVNHTTDNSGSQKSGIFQTLTTDGAWCWFSDPRAIYYEGKHKRTYAGWIDSNGSVFIGYYDHGSREIKSQVLETKYQKDDHDNPALLFRPDGRLMVFFTKHGGTNPTLLYVMKEPENITGWDRQELFLNDTKTYKKFTPTNTYVNPVMLSGENNRIYIFWRGMDNKPNYSFSDDLGKTWSKGRIFVLPERIYYMRRPYMKVDSDGRNTIMFAFTDGHPNNEKENSIYCMYYRKGGLFNVKGEKIGELGDVPVEPRQASVVYDATITKQKAWIWDVAIDSKGNPVLVYVKFPDNLNHVYCYARWNGKEWITSDLINTGKWFPDDKKEREPNYSGGLVLDHEDPGIVYLSARRDPKFEIEKWITTDGLKWKVEPITKGSEKDNVRPFAVRNASGKNPLQVLWMENTFYVHYTDYLSAIKMNVLKD
jgi:hypothetical protein